MRKMTVLVCLVLLISLFSGIVEADLEEESVIKETELSRKKIELLEKKMRVIKLEINAKEEKSQRLERRIQEYEEKLDSEKITEKEVKELKGKIEELENNYAGIQEELRNLRKKKYQYEKEIRDLKRGKWKREIESNFNVVIGLIRGEQDASLIELKYSMQKVDIFASFALQKKESKWWEEESNEYEAGSISFVGSEREFFRKNNTTLKGGIIYLNGKGLKPSLSTEINKNQFFIELRVMGIDSLSYFAGVGVQF